MYAWMLLKTLVTSAGEGDNEPIECVIDFAGGLYLCCGDSVSSSSSSSPYGVDACWRVRKLILSKRMPRRFTESIS